MRHHVLYLIASSLILAMLMGAAPLPPQQPTAPAKPGGGRGPRQPVPDDDAGFTPLFDGKSLTNWDGDADFWRAEDGAIVGQSTTEKPLKSNTFVIWKG